MAIDFEVKVATRALPRFTAAAPGIALLLLIPPFMATDIDASKQQLLAGAVGENDLSKLVFLSIGQTCIAGLHMDDPDLACVARLEPGDSEAVVSYQIALSTGGPVIRYEPQTFLRILEQVTTWAKSNFATGQLRPAAIPAVTDPQPARSILAAVVGSWSKARDACPTDYKDPLIQDLLPNFQIDGFQSQIVLRLKQNGALAERPSDDAFRLRMSAAGQEDTLPPSIRVSLGPPDFLVSGDLHDKLVAVLQGNAISHLFASSGLPDSERVHFSGWFADSAKEAPVFRAIKDGDQDADIFAFSGLWNGFKRTVVVVAKVKVTSKDDEFQVKLIDDPIVSYTDIPGATKEHPDPLLPRYFLTLLNQLSIWLRTFGGE